MFRQDPQISFAPSKLAECEQCPKNRKLDEQAFWIFLPYLFETFEKRMSRDKNISTLLRLIRIGRLSWMTSWYDATCCRGNKFHSIERKREQSRYIRVMTSLFCVPRDLLIYLLRIFESFLSWVIFLGMKQCLIHKISVSVWAENRLFFLTRYLCSSQNIWIAWPIFWFREDPEFRLPPSKLAEC